MVDFRRMIPVLAVIAFLLGSAVTASAQQTLSCVTNGAVNTPMRSEGLTEQTGDFLITCTGGTPTAAGAPVSTVNIQIFLNTSVTSRLMSTSSTLPQLSEALLLLDEPPPGAQFACPNSPATGATCPAVGAGAGAAFAAIYGGGTLGTLGNTRNVYQGYQTASNSITWLGIPIDPPGTIGTRIIRMTNLRGNANALGVSGTNVTPVSVFATVTATPFNFLPVSGLATQAVGSVQRGLQFGVFSSSSSTSAFSAFSLQQCVSRVVGDNSFAVLRYSELFATSFKRRNIATGSGIAGTTGAALSPTGSAEQNSLSGFTAGTYNTESGFTTGALAGGTTLPSMGSGFQAIGQADFGTRLKAVFNNVPNGISLFVDRVATANGGADTAVLTASETGPFAAVAATSGSPATGTSTQLTVTNGTATAVWEVLDSQATSFAVLNFRVWATFTASPGTNSPALGVATVNGSYAPTSTVTTASPGPIPRFADTSTASNVFTVIPCVTNLLFPYVTSQFGFDTGLAISATSIDPFGTSGQSGTCTLNWYGAAFTGATPTPVVNAGTTYTTLASSTLNNVTGGFTGYMIAQCRFQYAHGFAFVSDLGARNLAMGYLALIIPDYGLGTAAGARPPNDLSKSAAGAGEQLGY